RLESGFVDDRHIPLAKFQTDVALDPREGVFLTDGDQHVVAFHEHEVFTGRHQRTFATGVVDGFDFLEFHADQFAVLHDKLFRHMVIEYRNAFAFGVFDFPGRGFHVGARRTHGHRHAVAAETDRGAAAIHGGIAAAEHDHFFADAGDMAESDAAEPVDTDMDIGLAFFAARNFQIAAARRAGADEDGVVTLGENALEAIDVGVEMRDDTHVEDVADFFVEHGFGQTERRNLAAHETAARFLLVVNVDGVAIRHQIARHGQRCRAGADQCNAFAVFLGGN